MPIAHPDCGDGEARAKAEYPIIQLWPPLLMSVRTHAQPPMRLTSASSAVLTQDFQAFVHPPVRPVP